MGLVCLYGVREIELLVKCLSSRFWIADFVMATGDGDKKLGICKADAFILVKMGKMMLVLHMQFLRLYNTAQQSSQPVVSVEHAFTAFRPPKKRTKSAMPSSMIISDLLFVAYSLQLH